MVKKTLALSLTFLLFWMSGPSVIASADRQALLKSLTETPYLELLEMADTLDYSRRDLDAMRRELERERKTEQDRLREEERRLDRRSKDLRKQLEELNRRASRDDEAMEEQRRELHCEILKLEELNRQKRTEREQAIPLAYDNRFAKLDLIDQWPARETEIQRALADGTARQRKHGDVEDIGIRVVGEGQADDIRRGEESVQRLKSYGLLPPELEDEDVNAYVRRLADHIGANSDLKVPLNVTVLVSDEINAFALPGGFLFVNTGLIERAETESELAGVIAHEIAHVTARHGSRLMRRASIAGIVFQAAQVAALIFTGGAVGLGTYYALQYGFFGLGMVLDLALLGVSRDFEKEADQLGTQYLWKAGFDPKGFVTFFDKMASEKGYVRSASFFRTHPPFFERIVATFSEIEYLPPKEDLRVDSTEFQEAKRRLAKALESQKEEQKERPTLRRMPQCDE